MRDLLEIITKNPEVREGKKRRNNQEIERSLVPRQKLKEEVGTTHSAKRAPKSGK
jgi:hypothetical protein